MKIPIRIFQEGAANWVEHDVEIDRPVQEWTDHDLHQLPGKMQWHTQGENPVMTRTPAIGGYDVAVTVARRRAETLEPLPLGDALANSAVWDHPETIREGDTLRITCPSCGGSLRTDKEFSEASLTIGQPEVRGRFFSTTCLGSCGAQFNYTPTTGALIKLGR